MKRLAAVILMSALCCSPLLAHAEGGYDSDRFVKVSIDAITVLFGAYFLNGEFKVNERMSAYTSLAYVDTRWTVNSTINPLPGWFLEAAVGGRWYLRRGSMSGFFVHDDIGFRVGFTYTGSPVNFQGNGIVDATWYGLRNKTMFGYSWVSDIGFFVDVMGGLEIVAQWGYPNPPTIQQITNVEARANIGWAF